LERLKREMLDHKRVDQLKLAGLTEERQEVFAAAVAILLGLFTSLPIERMEYSDGALREGLLYEFEERLQHHDIRERTALALSTHYRIDKRQANRVEQSVLALFDALSGPWEMPEEPYRAILGWAARLHEIGLAINYSGIHRHSAYILQHTDLPGFNQDDQALLAALVRFQRKGLKLSELPPLPNHDEQTVLRCIRILRLAVAAHHRRQDNLLPEWKVQAAEDQLVVTLPIDWCDENRLLMQNLEKEHRYCQEQGWPLLFQLG
ncbi:MAG: exopolyphosphatase, partial [Aeromonas sp.]|nr:exopolyphosphatase [Aeromonas sp.]